MALLFKLLLILLFAAAILALLTRLVAGRIARALPPTGEWMEVDGERIHYRSLGQGPAIVLVHGLGGQMKNFEYLPLQELAGRYRLVLVDRPGSGHSARSDDAKAGIAAQARLVAGFIRALRLPQPPLLVGHSLGGAIALSVALQEPQALAGLALIAPLTHFSPEVPAPFRALGIRRPWLRRLYANVLAAPLAILNSRATLALVFGPDRMPPDFPLRGGSLLGLRPAAFYGASTDLCAIEQDLPAQQERYGTLRLPVRVLYGAEDRVLDWQVQGQGLKQKVPQAELQVIPGGHMLPVTQTAATAAWLEAAARAAHGDLCNSKVQ
jgi:pimeloyl-ACP methyl ester carboxylesterase